MDSWRKYLSFDFSPEPAKKYIEKVAKKKVKNINPADQRLFTAAKATQLKKEIVEEAVKEAVQEKVAEASPSTLLFAHTETVNVFLLPALLGVLVKLALSPSSILKLFSITDPPKALSSVILWIGKGLAII